MSLFVSGLELMPPLAEYSRRNAHCRPGIRYGRIAGADLGERNGGRNPSQKTSKNPAKIRQGVYKLRHLVENAILHLKQWRGIAARYAKNTASFLAAIPIRCMVIWGNMI